MSSWGWSACQTSLGAPASLRQFEPTPPGGAWRSGAPSLSAPDRQRWRSRPLCRPGARPIPPGRDAGRLPLDRRCRETRRPQGQALDEHPGHRSGPRDRQPPPLSSSVGHLHRRRGRCERHPVGRVSTLLPGTPCRHAPRRAGRGPSRRRQGRRCREAHQAHKEGPLASDQVDDPTARRQTPERERVCANHSLAAVIERPQSPLGRGQSDVHDRGVHGHHRLREGDHAQAHHRCGSGDSSSDRASAVAEVLPGGLTGSHALSLGEPAPDRLRAIPSWASRWPMCAAKMQAGSSVAQAVVSCGGRTRRGT